MSAAQDHTNAQAILAIARALTVLVAVIAVVSFVYLRSWWVVVVFGAVEAALVAAMFYGSWRIIRP
jgi:hypothetical protein